MLVAEQIVRVNLGAENQFHALEIARAEIKLLIELAAALNQKSCLAGFELVQRGAVEFGLRLGNVKRVDNGKLAIVDLRGDRGAESTHQLLLREGVLIAARLRSMNRTTTTPERSANRADTCAAGSLLLPELLACTRDLVAVLGGGGSLPKRGPVVLDRLPKEAVVDLCREDLVDEFELSDLGPSEIYYVDVCHRSSLFALAIDAASKNFV